jgi:SAM-dependent methyltransferase
MDLLIEATRRAEQDHFWFRGFRRFVRPFVAKAVEGLTDPVLLDCGCGTGVNLAWLGELAHVTGIDLTWSGLQIARARGAYTVARATITGLPFPDASFDAVTSFDVLSVLDEARADQAIAEMRRVLRPGGAAVINTAALELLRGNHSVLAEEVHRYSRAELKSKLERHNLVVERLTYTNASLVPLLLPLRAIQRAVGLAPPEKAGWEITVPARPVNAALTILLDLEARIVSRIDMPVGSSLLGLIRKPATG